MNEKATEDMITGWIKNAEKNGELRKNSFFGKALVPTCCGTNGKMIAAIGATSIASVQSRDLNTRAIAR